MDGSTTVAALIGAVVGGAAMGAIIIFGYRTLLGKIIERLSTGVGVQVETKVAAALEEPSRQAAASAFSASELIATFRESSATLTRVIDLVQSSNDALKAEKKDIEGRNVALQTRLTDFTTKLESLKKTDEDQQSQLDRIGKERDQAIAERDAAQVERDQALAQAKVFEQQAIFATIHEQAANARAEKQESELAELRSQVTELTGAYKQQIADLTADYNLQLAEVRDRLAEVELKMAELSAELTETRAERDRYKQQAEDYRVQVDEYRQQAADAQTEVAKRDLTIAQLTADLATERDAKAVVE